LDTNQQAGSEDSPVVRITGLDTRQRGGSHRFVDLLGHRQHDGAKPGKVRQRFVDLISAIVLGKDLRQVTLRFAVRHLGSEELSVVGVLGDDLLHASAQDGPDQDAGVDDDPRARATTSAPCAEAA
jgi:hypothetical protein